MRPGILCSHILSGEPARHVEHDMPVHAQDSGWLILCADKRHADAELRVVDLDRYIDQDTALQELRDTLAEGQMANRTASGQPWTVEAIPAEAA